MRIENGNLIFTEREIQRAEKGLDNQNNAVDRPEEAARFANTINAYNTRTKGKFAETIKNWLYGIYGNDEQALQEAGFDGFVRAGKGRATLYYNNDVLSSVSEKHFNEQGNFSIGRDIEYDENGHKTSAKHFDKQGNLTYRYEYGYDENGMQTSEKHFDKQGNLTYRYEYGYDENGHKTSAKHFDEQGNLTYRYEYGYDENGMQTSEKDFDGQGNLIRRFEYEYDENGKPTSDKLFHGQDKLVQKTIYDENGNATHEYYMNRHNTVTE